jgi:peroxiredoxin
MLILMAATLHFSLATAAVAPWEIEDVMGKEAPQFTLKNLSGEEISLASFRGKVILINFWATWCKPCKVEMPSLNELYNTFKDRGLVVLGISIDSSEKPVEKFLKKIPLDFPILLDSEVEVPKEYKVFAYPSTFLIDKRGVLKEKFIGEIDWSEREIIERVEGYLKE